MPALTAKPKKPSATRFPGFPSELLRNGQGPKWAHLARMYRAPRTDRESVFGRLAKPRWNALKDGIAGCKTVARAFEPHAANQLKRLANRHSLFVAVEKHAARMYHALDHGQRKRADVMEAKVAALVAAWNEQAKLDEELFKSVIPFEARKPLRDLVVGTGADHVSVTVYRQRQMSDIGKLPLRTHALEFETGLDPLVEIGRMPRMRLADWKEDMAGRPLTIENATAIAAQERWTTMQAIENRQWFGDLPPCKVEITEMACRTALQREIEQASLRLEAAKASGDKQSMAIHAGQVSALVGVWSFEGRRSEYFPAMPPFEVPMMAGYRAAMKKPDREEFPGHRELVLVPDNPDHPILVIGTWRDLDDMARGVGNEAKALIENDLAGRRDSWAVEEKNRRATGKNQPKLVDPSTFVARPAQARAPLYESPTKPAQAWSSLDDLFGEN